MNAEQFLDVLRRSQLVEEDQLTEFLGALAASNGHRLPEDAEKLSKLMIEAGMLTEWQTEKLLAGKHKGFMLGKYKLLRHIGKGGMSQVYLAEHTLMKRKVAIKVLPANRVEDSTYLERFRAEAGIGEVIEGEGKVYFIVVPFIEGQEGGLGAATRINVQLPIKVQSRVGRVRFRKLRIAWSVGWGLAALLLILLWVRSYWWITNIQPPPIASRTLQCALEPGRIRIESYPLHTAEEKADWLVILMHIHKSHPDFEFWNRPPHPTFELQLNKLKPGSIRMIFPYWFAIVIAAIASVTPWLRWRFRLRTLLIATTLIAVVSALITWTTR